VLKAFCRPVLANIYLHYVFDLWAINIPGEQAQVNITTPKRSKALVGSDLETTDVLIENAAHIVIDSHPAAESSDPNAPLVSWRRCWGHSKSKKYCTQPKPTPPVARENGASRSSDGRLDIKLSTPGTARVGTNPEQLFAAGWSACFEGATGLRSAK
jgi:hypothetical protein